MGRKRQFETHQNVSFTMPIGNGNTSVIIPATMSPELDARIREAVFVLTANGTGVGTVTLLNINESGAAANMTETGTATFANTTGTLGTVFLLRGSDGPAASGLVPAATKGARLQLNVNNSAGLTTGSVMNVLLVWAM